MRGPLAIAASLVAEHRLQTRRLSNCSSRAQLLRGSRGSSQTRARTHVPCIGRQILNHCATREAQVYIWMRFLRYNSCKITSICKTEETGYLPLPHTCNIQWWDRHKIIAINIPIHKWESQRSPWSIAVLKYSWANVGSFLD